MKAVTWQLAWLSQKNDMVAAWLSQKNETVDIAACMDDTKTKDRSRNAIAMFNNYKLYA